MWKKIRNFLRIVIVTFFVSTILAVVAYKFLPVYVTPLMIIRCVEQIADGHSPRVEHKWISLDDMIFFYFRTAFFFLSIRYFESFVL